MSDARKYWENGYPSGTVAAAGYQIKGRGRLPARCWQSAPGKNLLFTVILDLNFGSAGSPLLPLGAGLAVGIFLEKRYGLKVKLKWPNDVLINRRKLCGVLCERRKEAVFLGVGINCMEGFGPNGISLEELGIRADPMEILPGLLKGFYAHFMQSDDVWLPMIRKRLYGKERTVKFEPSPGEVVEGILDDVDNEGRLIITTTKAGIVKKFYCGELRF